MARKIIINLKNLPAITNEKYLPLYFDNYRYLILWGGAGSGKSVFACQKIIFRCITEKNHRFLIVRKVARTIRHSVFELFLEQLRIFGLLQFVQYSKSTYEIYIPFTNSHIIFAGIDDPEKIKSITRITGMWIEEATELNEEDFRQLDLRLRGTTEYYKQIILTFNPVSKTHWIRQVFFKKGTKLYEKSKHVHSTYKDNRFIDEEYKEVLEGLKDENYNLYLIYALGQWGEIGEIIYTNWEEVEEFKRSDIVFGGIDFGYNNPSAVVLCSLWKNEIYIKEVLYEQYLITSELADKLLNSKENLRGIPFYCDSSEPDRIQELSDKGLLVYPADKSSVLAGIDFVKNFRLKITKNSINLLNEIKEYCWKKDKYGNILDEPVKFNDHSMDAMRYAIYTHLKNYKKNSGFMRIKRQDFTRGF